MVQGELLGAPDLAVSNARPIPNAQPGDITFADDEQLEAWRHCPAAAAVVPLTAERSRRPIIRVPDPLTAFARIVQAFRGRPAARVGGLHPTAVIDPTAQLGDGVSVGPHAVVGEGAEVGANTRLHAGVVVGRGCRLGADVVLHPHVVLYDDCVLGDRVVVHANAVLGADGFGYRLRDGRHERVPHVGWVEVEEDVEIGAGSTIDRGTFGPTRVGAGTKIDNLVMVAHNCRVGRHNILAGQVGLGGSTTTGEFVVMAGQAGAVDHVRIGDRAVVGARAAVLSDVPTDGRVLGYPARPAGSVKREWATFEHLPAMRKDLKRIKDRLDMTDAAPGSA